MNPKLYLFDDDLAETFDPFVLTRPLGELLFGTFLLRERAERFWGVPCMGHLSQSNLVGFSEPGAPPVVQRDDVGDLEARVIQSSRAVFLGTPPFPPKDPVTLVLEGQAVGWILPHRIPLPDASLLRNPDHLPGSVVLEMEGRILEAPWDLMRLNGEQLSWDIPLFFPGYAVEGLPGCHILGEGLLSMGSDVSVEPGSVFDVRHGPIRLADRVTVRAHTRLSGPAYVGPGSTLLGGVLSEISVGPVVKVRGEVECSVILGYTNKAHDGFLGHAYLGRWVNLGAFTTNSDLKNNYGPIRVGGATGPRETNLLKVGCFLGDHVKTGIGTFLNTGTSVGAGSNLFGGAMPPTYVPPFSWGSGSDLTEFRLEKFLEVATRAMSRRDMTLESGMEEVLRVAWEQTRQERLTGT